MARMDWVRPRNRWLNTTVPSSTDYARLDQAQQRVVDGDLGGGVWTPSAPITVGGAGMSVVLNTATGGARTKLGGRMVIGVADNRFPAFQNDAPYALNVPLLSQRTLIAPNSSSLREEDYIVPVLGTSVLGPSIWGVTMQAALGPAPSPPDVYFEIPSRYLHNGAQLARAQLLFVVSSRPSALPTSNPLSFLIAGVAVDLSVTNLLGTTPAFGTWAAGHVTLLSDYISPTTIHATGLYYNATSISGTGTTGGTEPTWPTVIGGTVIDSPGPNQVVWTAVGASPQIAFASKNIGSYYNNGAPQILAFDLVVNNDINTTNQKYMLYVQHCDSTITLISLRLFFAGIADARFA